MLNKIIKNSLLCIIIVLSTYIVSACCGPRMCEINVKFHDVDETLNFTDYTEIVEAGYGVTVNVELPIGYVYDNFSAKVGDYELDWEVTLSDPTIEPEYEYTVPKTLTVKIDKVNNHHDIDIDMSGVRLKKLKVTVAEDILNNSITKDLDDKQQSNLQLVTINPDYLSNLMYLRGDAIIGKTDFSITGEAYIEYGNYAILCYKKDNQFAEMPTLYSSVGKFTPSNKLIEYKDNMYAEYNMSTKGNVPYNIYEDGLAVSNSRLYYMGQIQENMDFYRQIPNFEVTKGVTFEDKKNQFVLITNRQDYNSDLLSLSVYAPTISTFNESIETYDKVDSQTIVKIDKYNNGGGFKNENVYSEYGKRYDMVSMYIGDNITNDIFLSQEEKNSLSSSLYLVVESELPVEKLNISLISYEKQNQNDYPILQLTDFVQSYRGRTVFKFDRELIQDFIKERIDSVSGTKYYLANAFLDITFGQQLVDENWESKEYTTIMFPLEINGRSIDYDNDYQIEIFVEDEEGNRDYGLIDRHSSNSDVALFKSTQIYNWSGSEWVARNDFYINIKGPQYNDYYTPYIDTIFLYKPYNVLLVGQHGLNVQDPKVCNGVEKYRINLGMQLNSINNSTYIGRQLRLRIALSVATENIGNFGANFDNIIFGDVYNDAIYMSNDFNFDSIEDFTRIDSIVVDSGNYNIRFGYYCDIYYFVYSTDDNLEFDMYVGYNNTDNNLYEGVYSSNRKISGTKELRDVLGNIVRVRDNAGRLHIVYTKYQICDVYKISGIDHFAYNPNDYCSECDAKLVDGNCPNC